MSPARPFGVAWWRERALQRIHQGIAWYLPHAVAGALRRNLAGVWSIDEGPPPAGGAVVIANHHSWWDGYLAWLIARRCQRPLAVLVDAETLVRYPFFRRVGALPVGELRSAVRRTRAGAWLFVFPEGRLRPPGDVGPFARGAGAVARLADVPVVPMAWRVVMRGVQHPEVYLRRGVPLPATSAPGEQRAAVAALLARIDRDLDAADAAEAPLPGYTALLSGRPSAQERVARWRRWWGG